MQMGSFQSEEFGELQRLVDGMFAGGRTSIERLDIVVQAEILDRACATRSTPRSRPTAGPATMAPWSSPGAAGRSAARAKRDVP